MLLYAFQGRYGGDKLCRTDQSDFAVGDLLIGKSDMFLVLSTDNSRLKTQNIKLPITEELTLHHKGFLTPESVELIHRMTKEYYTSYKNVVKLFVTGELADLFKKEITTKRKPHYLTVNPGSTTNILGPMTHDLGEHEEGQQLIIFPDVWTMINTLKIRGVEEKTGIAMVNSTSTQQQKDKIRWGIKMGHINTLICTYSQIFQEWKDLRNIVLIDSHQWYYKNQQDPRYDTREIVKKMASLYDAKLTMTGVKLFA